LPGLPASITEARRFVTSYLRELPPGLVMMAELAASELATNAVRHSRSGQPGGMLWVTVTVFDTVVRIAVTDQGGPGDPVIMQAGESAECGRGLQLMAAMVREWGHHPAGNGRTVWVLVDDVDRG
jgi:anti-sigma regulatory factor (Ser/Thr protein kinase)